MKAEKSQDLQSPGQRPWRVQAQVKTWRAEDKFHSKSEDKRKPISQLESNRVEREFLLTQPFCSTQSYNG